MLLAAAFLVGCSGAPESAPIAHGAPPKAAAAPPAPRLALGELTVTFDGTPIARLHADGTSESVDKRPPGSPMTPGPTLHADGTVTFTGSDVTLHLEADGTLRLHSRESDEVLATITATALVFTTTPDQPIRFDGDILWLPGGADRNRVAGAATAALRVTALVLTAAFYVAPSLAAPARGRSIGRRSLSQNPSG